MGIKKRKKSKKDLGEMSSKYKAITGFMLRAQNCRENNIAD